MTASLCWSSRHLLNLSQTSAQAPNFWGYNRCQRSNWCFRPASTKQSRTCSARSESMSSGNSSHQKQRQELEAAWQLDADKPWYHIMPRSGWLNDPNGPIYYQGRYHVFYQHIEGTSQWEWRMSWGHASSSDLVFWQHEAIAINPTKGGNDASGCWSGTIVLDNDGSPIMIYTGVRRRDNKDCGALPHAAVDLGLDMIECQMLARCQEGDKKLIKWDKREKPIIPHPPENMKLTGFRDPYIIQKGDGQKKWKMLLGSGIEGQGGLLLVYETSHPDSEWQYKGSFINGKSKPLGKHDLGAMWECPFFTAFSTSHNTSTSSSAALSLSEDELYVMCVSPYPHFLKDRLTNPCLYWLGHVKQEQFMIEESDGPHLLDLGDCLYAPNCFRDAEGRNIMLAWLQELRKGGGFDYAGCISLPRMLTYKDGCLHQEVAQDLKPLRQEPSWSSAILQVPPSQAVQVQQVSGPSWYAEYTVVRGEAAATGLLLRSWLYQGPEEETGCAAALLLDWQNSQLEMVFPTSLDSDTKSFDASTDMKRVGGPVRLHNVQEVQIKVYADHSAVEVFVSSGEALTTRVYRGAVTPEADPGLYFTSHGGQSIVKDVHFHTMRSIWIREADRPQKQIEPADV